MAQSHKESREKMVQYQATLEKDRDESVQNPIDELQYAIKSPDKVRQMHFNGVQAQIHRHD